MPILYKQRIFMRRAKFLFLFLLFSVFGCLGEKSITSEKVNAEPGSGKIEVHGHRGDRGNFPENSIPAFLSAVKKGVDFLEMDVVISKDKKVVVSHEPYMASLFMLTAAGESIPESFERSFNLYKMDYDSIRQFDSGSKGNNSFPNQQKITTYKPLLSEVIDSVETFIAAEDLRPVMYSIELKSDKAEYYISQPAPEEFVKIVMEVISQKSIEDKVIIQSFDPEILNLMHSKHPEIEVAYLVADEGIEKNLKLLNFTPAIYSPHFKLVRDEKFVDSVRAKEMRLVPWTVNELKEIQSLIEMGVDGIISDYPERVISNL